MEKRQCPINPSKRLGRWWCGDPTELADVLEERQEDDLLILALGLGVASRMTALKDVRTPSSKTCV